MPTISRVWNPLDRPVQVSIDGLQVAGLTEADVDLDDGVAAAALAAGELVVLAPAEAVMVAESVESEQTEADPTDVDSAEVDEAPSDEEEATQPAPRTRKKPATQAKES